MLNLINKLPPFLGALYFVGLIILGHLLAEAIIGLFV